MMKYATMDWGTMEAVVNKLGGLDGVQKFLCGELIVSEPVHRWREQDGVIYLIVTSDGITGPQWIEYFEKKGIQLTRWSKDVLESSDFKPTKGVTTQIAVLKGELFSDSDRVTHKIRAEAERRKLTKPNAEVACLIREKFTDKELKVMGLYWIVVFHEPIEDSDGDPNLLTANCFVGSFLSAFCGKPGRRWDRDNGFAFVACNSFRFSPSFY